MANIIKVEEVGQEFTGTVTSCSEVEGKYGRQVQFDFADGSRLFVTIQAAVRQLLRCGFDGGKAPGGDTDLVNYEAVEGNTLTFGRDHNPKGKPYWRIELADGVDAPAKKAAPKMTHEAVAKAAVPKPSAVHPVFDEILAGYRTIWAQVAAVQGQKATPESIQSGVATLMIQASQKGVPLPTKLERVKAEDADRELDF